jgi:TatD DNase family protein
MKNIFDSHAHYDDEAFNDDRADVIAGLPAQGICGVVNCGSNKDSSLSSLKLSETYSYFYAACGIHPHNAGDAQIMDFLQELPRLTAHEKCVAIGEIGLDYHYDFSPREVQNSIFEKQLILAVELDMPVIVHDREAHEDMLRLLRKYKPRGVMHCFSGSTETAAEIVKLGMYIGLGGAVTFKNAKKPLEAARFVPAERLLIETDCPYMAPVPYRGKRCDSAMIPYTAQVIAGIRGVDTQSLLDLTAKNAKDLFATA